MSKSERQTARLTFSKSSKMKQLDEIIYDAIKADESLMAKLAYATPQGGTAYAVRSTCFEVPPDELDNTPVPYVVIHDDGFQNQQTTKDCVWEALEDQVQATVEIAADSPEEVKQLIKAVRKAVESYIVSLYSSGEDIPELLSLTSDGIDWDWMKPCYYSHLVYQCITNTDTDDEQEETT